MTDTHPRTRWQDTAHAAVGMAADLQVDAVAAVAAGDRAAAADLFSRSAQACRDAAAAYRELGRLTHVLADYDGALAYQRHAARLDGYAAALSPA
jgi:hypothetical protein